MVLMLVTSVVKHNDGAGNMAGKCRGAAACIQYVSPNAVYVNCSAHTLNLCIVDACGVQLVKNMMETMVQICLFFSYSPKRQLELEAYSIQKVSKYNLCAKHVGLHV